MLIIANFKIFQLSKWHFDAFWGYIPNQKKPNLAAVPGGRPSSAARWSVAPGPRAERLDHVSNSGDQYSGYSWNILIIHTYECLITKVDCQNILEIIIDMSHGQYDFIDLQLWLYEIIIDIINMSHGIYGQYEPINGY
jgi:hypothetical protein